MNKVGSARKWLGFIDTQVPAIIRMVLETWEAFEAPYCDELEDATTERFCKALRRSRDRCDLPFRIDIQLVELDPAAGEDQGRMDIVFSPPAPREDIYFCLECKRLNVRMKEGIRPYFAEYVVYGMLRFVRGQYARASKHGAMVAYVLDGNLASAISGVEKNLVLHVEDLGLELPARLRQSLVFADDDRVRESSHTRFAGLTTPFTLHHLFLTGRSDAAFRPA